MLDQSNCIPWHLSCSYCKYYICNEKLNSLGVLDLIQSDSTRFRFYRNIWTVDHKVVIILHRIKNRYRTSIAVCLIPAALMSSRNTLPQVNRYITTNSDSGESLLDTTIPSSATWRHVPEASFFLSYVTKTFPVVLENDRDLDDYTDAYAAKPKATRHGGTILRVLDLGPGVSSPMHRTVSLAYSVVLEGEVELRLDLDTKVMRRGDVCVQRATNHAWTNTSLTEWARMLFVHVDSTKPVVDGRALGESIEGVDFDLPRLEDC